MRSFTTSQTSASIFSMHNGPNAPLTSASLSILHSPFAPLGQKKMSDTVYTIPSIPSTSLHLPTPSVELCPKTTPRTPSALALLVLPSHRSLGYTMGPTHLISQGRSQETKQARYTGPISRGRTFTTFCTRTRCLHMLYS